MKSLKFHLMLTLSIFTTDAVSNGGVIVDDQIVSHLKKFRSDCSKGMLENKPELFQAYYSDTVRLCLPFKKR